MYKGFYMKVANINKSMQAIKSSSKKIFHNPISWVLFGLSIACVTVNLKSDSYNEKEFRFVNSTNEKIFDSHRILRYSGNKEIIAKADSVMAKCANYIEFLADSVSKIKK